MGGLPLEFILTISPKKEFINKQLQNGSPPLEFININLKMGSTFKDNFYGSSGMYFFYMKLLWALANFFLEKVVSSVLQNCELFRSGIKSINISTGRTVNGSMCRKTTSLTVLPVGS